MQLEIEIADTLFDEARQAATEDGAPVDALVDAGLRAVLAMRGECRPFELRDGSVSGGGIRPEYEGNWDKMLEAIYEGRGA